MSIIKAIDFKIAELYKELNILEKQNPSPENMNRVKEIEKQARELANAKRMRQNQIGIRVTA